VSALPAPSLSVVVPVYNGAATLEGCLRSVQAAVDALPPQRRERVEVVVCDNHSTDASAQIARATRFACRSRVLAPPAHLPNRTENWHHGLSAAAGDWLLMLHADDALVDEALAAWLDAIAGPLASRVGFMTGRQRRFSTSLDELGPPHPRLFPFASLLSGRALVRWVMPLLCPFLPLVLIRRGAYEEVGGFDRRLELTQDWDLWIRLCRRYDVLYVPRIVGAFRDHPTGVAYQRVNMAEHLAVLAALQRDPATPPPRAVRWLARRSMNARVTKVLRGDDTDEARRLRAQAGELVAGGQGLSERWLQVSETLVSATLYVLRTRGAARRALAERTRG